MTTHTQHQPVRDSRTAAVVSALVGSGLVDSVRESEAAVVVDRALTGQAATSSPLRNRFAELAGYLGGALVVAAAGIFFSTEWGNLSEGERVGLLAGTALLLALAGAVLAFTGGGLGALRTDRGAVRRRLAGLLLTGAAVAGSAAVGLEVARSLSPENSTDLLLASLTMLLVSAVGYLVAPTVVGQLGTAVGAFMAVPWALDVVADVEPVAFGLIVLGLGIGWLNLAEGGVWREVASARVIGCVLALVGAQIPVFDYEHRWLAYVTMAVVAAAAFAAYVVRPSWPYLTAGVIGVTVSVPEALLDWTDGSLGAAGGLLVAGATLLAASLLGLRLRQAAVEESAGLPEEDRRDDQGGVPAVESERDH